MIQGHSNLPESPGAQAAERPRRTIAITGSSGAIGGALCTFLAARGDRVLRLVRRPVRIATARAAESRIVGKVQWNPLGEWDPSALEGIDAVVHLAGENLAEGRWTAARKRAILESRAEGTRNLAGHLAALNKPPAVLVSASGVGRYGNRTERALDESAPAGSGFLSQVTQAWEAALEPAEQREIRTVRLRIGPVVSAKSGVIARMRLPFLLGMGGRVGSGLQGMSWIHLGDLVAAICFAIENESVHGAVNAVAPNPVSQIEFARSLARALHRPCIMPLPAPIVRLLFGEMGSELLLSGQFVQPAQLLRHGFRFRCATIDEALSLEFGATT